MGNAPMLTRWAVVFETSASTRDVAADGGPDEAALGRWFDTGLRAYADRSSSLCAELDRTGGLRVIARHVAALGPLEVGDAVLVAVSVTELRDTSFDMRLRVRDLADGGSIVGTGRLTVRGDPDSPIAISEAIRRDLLAIEAAATEFC